MYAAHLSSTLAANDDQEGSILHEYKLIKGFVVKASVEAIEGFHALSADHPATIEEDTTVTIQ